MEPNKRVSLQDFKNWMSGQKDLSNFFNIQEDENPYDKYIGRAIKTKVSKNKLMERANSEDEPKELLIDEFIENGGTILSVDEKKVLVEVDSGKFYVPRFCVKIAKD